MMSVSPGMAAGQAGGYFLREDYYLRGTEEGDNSLWCGEGARALGLHGAVGEEEFHALCRGEDPTGKRIVSFKVTRDKVTGAPIEKHRAGNDCTFSPTKSVSIAYCVGVSGIKEAHDAAVLSVLEHMEGHYCHYRNHDEHVSGKMVAAKFDHATSRNVDPQLHSHVFVLNVAQTEEGGWKANEPRAIFQDQWSLGLLYRQALARELQERGFQIIVQDRSQMLFELKGVAPELLRHFSSRREAIEQQVERWRSEGKFSEVPHGRLYEMAALQSRDPKRAITRQEVTRIFERGFELCGTSPEAVRRVLEQERHLAPTLHDRVPAHRVVDLAVRELTEREAVLDRARLLDQVVRISGGQHSLPELNAAIESGAGGVLRFRRDAMGREFYTTREMLDLESRNLQRIRELPSFDSVVHVPEVEAFLERLGREGVLLTAGQRAEVLNELTGNRGAALTLGDPGTAKTSTLKVIERFNAEVLRPEGREHVSVNLAYTGKAVRELGLATGRPASTISSFEKANPASKFALQRANGEPPMVVVAGEKILIPEGTWKQVVLRVDEAGFLGARQAHHLLGTVEELQQRGVRVKLHLLGDSKQMQGIQAGDLLRQVEELGVRQEVDFSRLTEILRQRDRGLLEIAKQLNREDCPPGENAREALRSLATRREVLEITDPHELRRAAVDHYLEESRKPSQLPERAAAGEPQQVLLVTGTNSARKELNREIRHARVAAGEIEQGRSFPVLTPVRQGVTVEGYQVGDTLLFSGERGENGRMVNWGARLHTEGKVTGLDRESNRVQVGYSFSTRDPEGRKTVREVTKEFSAAELAGRTTLLREEERNFAVGDRIVTLKNDPKLGVQNGSLGVIRELDDRGMAKVDLGDRQVILDLHRYRHIDHAYAVTIHKSQGATVEHSIMYAPVRPEKVMELEHDAGQAETYGRTSYNALNVAVTRAQFGTRIFTNSIEGLTRSVQMVDGKTSTLTRLQGPEREVAGRAGGRLAEANRELQRSIGNLERAMLRPGDGVRRRELSLEQVLTRVRAPGLRLPEPVLKAPAVQKVVERQLEHALPKELGIELKK